MVQSRLGSLTNMHFDMKWDWGPLLLDRKSNRYLLLELSLRLCLQDLSAVRSLQGWVRRSASKRRDVAAPHIAEGHAAAAASDAAAAARASVERN